MIDLSNLEQDVSRLEAASAAAVAKIEEGGGPDQTDAVNALGDRVAVVSENLERATAGTPPVEEPPAPPIGGRLSNRGR
jgi:hypothetical protein